MEGEKALFIHSLDAGDNKAREYLLGVIEDFSQEEGVSICLHPYRETEEAFFKEEWL